MLIDTELKDAKVAGVLILPGWHLLQEWPQGLIIMTMMLQQVTLTATGSEATIILPAYQDPGRT